MVRIHLPGDDYGVDGKNHNDFQRDKDAEGFRCSFEYVDICKEGQQQSKELEEGTELQVLPKMIYIGHKYKTKWSDVQQVDIEESRREVQIKCHSFLVRACQPQLPHSQHSPDVLPWNKFAKRLANQWNKRQRKEQRKVQRMEEEQQAARDLAKKKSTSRLSNKGRSSKASNFLLRNAQNIKDWDSDDDAVFNRLTPKELAANKRKHEEPDDEANMDSEAATIVEELDESETEFVDAKRDIKPSSEDSDDVEMDNAEHGDQSPREAKERTTKPKKSLRKLKRKRPEVDSDDDEEIFGRAQLTTPITVQRIVSPGTTQGRDLFKDDDDNDDDMEQGTTVTEETNTVNPEESKKSAPTKRSSRSILASFLSRRDTSAPPPAETTVTIAENTEQSKGDPAPLPPKPSGLAAFFAPRREVPTTKKSPPKATTPLTTPPKDAPIPEDDATVIPTPSQSTPKEDHSRKTPSSTFLFQSATALEHQDDPIADSDSDTDQPHSAVNQGQQPGPLKRRLFVHRNKTYGSQPSRSKAMRALEMAEAASPSKMIPFAGMGSNVKVDSPIVAKTSPQVKPLSPPKPTISLLPTWRGLKNLGNTCYMNSSLQMLYTVTSFLRAVSNMQQGRRLASSFCQTFQSLRNKELPAGAISPRNVKAAMDAVTGNFQGYQQRDAHEFLGELLDQLHEELETDPQKEQNQNDTGNNGGQTSDKMETQREDDSQTLPTDDFFRLNVEVCLKCKSCGYSRTKEEMYRYLSIDIASPGANGKPTVEQCLERFFQPEERDINCEKCKDGCKATQTMRIISRPKVLLLHLKRFVLVEVPRGENDQQSMGVTFKKNRTAVDLTPKLSLNNFVRSDDKQGAALAAENRDYALQSVVYHIGSTANSGHYTADARRLISKAKGEEDEDDNDKPGYQWVSYDDGITSETSLGNVRGSLQNQSTAYMLLYSTV